jgi:nucleotide-binding universal stress UspA family protein
MYKKILLAYDGSREGLSALREGALLAKQCGAQVFLLSVLPETAGVRMAEVYGDCVGQQIETYKALLAQGVAVAKRLGLEPVSRLVIGEPAVLIGTVAREISADLVVLGHQRHNSIKRWWSGSTGGYVSDHTHCSVLVGCNAITDEDFEAHLQDAGVS